MIINPLQVRYAYLETKLSDSTNKQTFFTGTKTMSNSHKIVLDHDTRLMLKVTDGNRRAFERLYLKYFPILRRFLTKRNSHHLLLNDIVQKVFTRIWKQRKKYQPMSSFQTYLFSVAKNVLSEDGKYFRKTNITHLDLHTASGFPPELMDSKAKTHHLNMTRHLYEAINNLPTKSAQAIKLRYFRNLSTSDAAKIADCSPQAFRQRLHYARDKLQNMLSRKEHSDLFSEK